MTSLRCFLHSHFHRSLNHFWNLLWKILYHLVATMDLSQAGLRRKGVAVFDPRGFGAPSGSRISRGSAPGSASCGRKERWDRRLRGDREIRGIHPVAWPLRSWKSSIHLPLERFMYWWMEAKQGTKDSSPWLPMTVLWGGTCCLAFGQQGGRWLGIGSLTAGDCWEADILNLMVCPFTPPTHAQYIYN
jgi:hypothetical protein